MNNRDLCPKFAEYFGHASTHHQKSNQMNNWRQHSDDEKLVIHYRASPAKPNRSRP